MRGERFRSPWWNRGPLPRLPRADCRRVHAQGLGLAVEHIHVETPEDRVVVESFHAGPGRDYVDALVFNMFAEAEAFLAWAFEDYAALENAPPS